MATSKETRRRSIIKAVSWRFVATLTTVSIVFCLTRKLDLADRIALSTAAGAVDVVAKLILYYLHERVWATIGFGKKEHPLSCLPVDRPLEEKDRKIIEDKLKALGYIGEE